MNYINDYVLRYHDQLIKDSLSETSEVCEDSRYWLGKYADVRADILMKMFKNTRWKFVYQAWHEKQCMIALRDLLNNGAQE